MDKKFLMEVLEIAISSTNINENTKNKAYKKYEQLKKDRDSYMLSKKQAKLFIDEYNTKIVDDEAEIIFSDEDFITIISFKNYDLDSNNVKSELEDKYLKDCSKNVSYRYTPNTYYSSLY